MPAFARKQAGSAGSADRLRELLDEQATTEKKSKGGGILGSLKHLGGDVLSAIDLPRAAVVSAATELGDAVGGALGRDTGSTASLSDWYNQTKNHMGAGDVIEHSAVGDHLGKWGKRIAGGVLDAASDPTNAVTFGSGEVAKEGLAKAGQVIGDQAAKQALREGGLAGLRDAVESAGKGTLEDVLARGTGDLGAKGADRVSETLSELGTKRAQRGGAAIALPGGHSLGGFGGELADKALTGLKQSDIGQAVRPLFNPTSKVADKFGVGAGGAVDNAIHSASQARRGASLEGAKEVIGRLDETGIDALRKTPRGERLRFLQDAADGFANEGLKDGEKAVKGVWDANVQKKVASAITDDMLDSAPELISNVPREGWVDLGNGFHVPQPVKEALDGAVSSSPNDIVKAIDSGTNFLKRFTTLGPLNAVPHVSRNIFSNMLFAGMYGGVKDVRLWQEASAARKVLVDLAKEGEEVTAETLARKGLTGQKAARALALHEEGLAGRGGHLFDDVANEVDDVGSEIKSATTSRKEGQLGTRTASKVNEWHEELSRGAVFLQGLDEGLSPQNAAMKSRKAMLDYSQEGLTKFERDKLARLVFFYKFPRRAVPAGVKFTIEHPGAAHVASRLGAGVDLGDRNSFGDPIGPYFDTPLQSAADTLSKFGKDPVGEAVGSLHPVLQALGDPDKRTLRDVLPPLDQAGNRLEGKPTLFGPGTGILGPSAIPGQRIGVDYESNYNTDAKDKKAGKDTPTTRLAAAAEHLGIDNPYTLNEKELLSALAKAGASEATLLQLLKGESKSRIPSRIG